MRRRVTRYLVWTALLGAVLALAIACGGVSQKDLDAVKTQLSSEQQKSAALQQQLSGAQQQVSAKDSEAKGLQDKLAAKEKEAAELQKQVGDLAGITPLIYAKPMPTPTPRPTPTPLPAGATPPPAATIEPAVVNEVLPFALYVETLATSSVSKYGLASFPACVPNAIFKRGSKLVWRFEVVDTSTGKRVTSLDTPGIKINLPNGETLTARYSKRGGTGPWTWAAGWDIPTDYPLGAFDYTITVDAGGRSYNWKTPALVNKDRGIDSRVQIID